MFLPQPHKLSPQLDFFLFGHRSRSLEGTLSCVRRMVLGNRKPHGRICGHKCRILTIFALHHWAVRRLTTGLVAY